MEQAPPARLPERLGPLARYELRVVLLAAATATLGIPFGLLLHQVVEEGPLTAFDDRGARWLNARLHDQDAALAALRAISFTGKPAFLLFAVGLPVLWLLRRGAHRLGTFLVVTSVGGGLVSTIVKVVVGRPRPVVDEPVAEAFGNSFPSGHSMAAVCCYGALLLAFLPLVPARWRSAAIAGTALLVALIGLSRLTLGVHYLTDVLGGYLLGAAWLAASAAAFEIWREERHLPRTEPLAEGVEPEELEEAVGAGERA